jgi:class 3 adenylate cyclase/tetratricopeptide (TPR) repeat protein/energy-coupling factor transporter ATP-binding protein EcfA2
VLFADVSGFTPLVTRLAEGGAGGTERAQGILNAAFAPLGALVEESGGEILSFPGDAALALWTGDESAHRGLLAAHAAECAQRIQQFFAGLTLQPGAKLQLRIVVSCGELAIANVGGMGGEWGVLVCGEPMVQIREALRATNPGETVLTAEAARAASGRLQTRLLGGFHKLTRVETLAPLAKPPRPGASEASVRAYVPLALRLRADRGQLDWLGEFRSVTTLFVGIDGFTTLDSGALPALQNAVQAVQSATLRFDGAIHQLVHDEKGIVFVIAFGTAHHVHEDDAMRALSAALEIVASLAQLHVTCRVGVSTGSVFSGTRGSETRKELALVGASVNLAARLMGAAEPILTDSATHALTHHRVLFEAREALVIKGLEGRVPVYRPVARRTGNDFASAIVGRTAECSVLEGLVAELQRAASSRVVLIDGTPGIGKSRLVQHIARVAQPTSLRVLVEHADSIEADTPYYSWRSVVASMLGLGPSPSAEQTCERLEQLLGEAVVGREALLNPVLPLSLPEGALHAQLSPRTRASATRELLVALTTRVASASPMILVFEDTQWLDEASALLIEQIAHRVPGLLLVITSRLEPTRLSGLRASGPTISLRLQELSRDEALELIGRRLGVDSLPKALADPIYLRSEGHPLFAEQLVSTLVARRLVRIEGGECIVADSVGLTEALEVPENVSSVLTSRIDRLPPEQQLLLKVASVIGREFDAALLDATYPLALPAEGLAHHLEEMIDKEFLAHADESGRLHFRHGLIQDSVYQLLPFSQRRALHERVAIWLESTHREDRQQVLARIAHHYERASNVDKAIEYLDLAATQALERDHVLSVAAGLFRRLLDLDSGRSDTDSVRSARWRRLLADALIQSGKMIEALPHLEQALRLLGRPSPPSRLRLARILGGGLLPRLLRFPRGPAQTAAPAREREALRETVAAFELLVRSGYVTGRSLEAIASCVEALPLAEQLGASPEFCSEYAMFANVVALLGQRRLAQRYRELAHRAATEIDDPISRSMVESRGSVYRLNLCEWEVKESFERALEVFESVGDYHEWSIYAIAASRVDYALGNYDESEALCLAALERARAGRSRGQEVWALAGLGDLLFRRGRLDQAREYLENALAIAEAMKSIDQGILFQASGAAALVDLRTGHPDGAARHAELAFRAYGLGAYMANTAHAGFMGIAETLLFLLDRTQGDQAGKHRRRLRAVLRTMALLQTTRPTLRPLTRLYQGRALLQRGRRGAGVRRLRQALASAEHNRMPYESGLAEAELARAGPESLRDGHLARARDLFKQIGAEAELLRLDGLAGSG